MKTPTIILILLCIVTNLYSQDPAKKSEIIRTDKAVFFGFNGFNLNSGSFGYKQWVSPSIVLRSDIKYHVRHAEENRTIDHERQMRNYYFVVNFDILKHIYSVKQNSVYVLGGLGFLYDKATLTLETDPDTKRQQKRYGINSQFGLGFEYFLKENISLSAEVFAYAGYETRTISKSIQSPSPELSDSAHDDGLKAFSIRNGPSALMLSIYF